MVMAELSGGGGDGAPIQFSQRNWRYLSPNIPASEPKILVLSIGADSLYGGCLQKVDLANMTVGLRLCYGIGPKEPQLE